MISIIYFNRGYNICCFNSGLCVAAVGSVCLPSPVQSRDESAGGRASEPKCPPWASCHSGFLFACPLQEPGLWKKGTVCPFLFCKYTDINVGTEITSDCHTFYEPFWRGKHRYA